jgi:hypothetical protein
MHKKCEEYMPKIVDALVEAEDYNVKSGVDVENCSEYINVSEEV